MKKLAIVLIGLLTLAMVVTSCGSSKRGMNCPANVQ
jgi:predicted small secreted protein